ncbi:MAG: hypothetical protein DWQ02_24375 [Bacteroidetes bacterium]|nr:MAG: hypothetical protein DWQ02_24375 [Bacteroidota bacterium]
MKEFNLISGIYNYCDRWCKRCAFTERWAVFQEEKAEGVMNARCRVMNAEGIFQGFTFAELVG